MVLIGNYTRFHLFWFLMITIEWRDGSLILNGVTLPGLMLAMALMLADRKMFIWNSECDLLATQYTYRAQTTSCVLP